MNRKIKRIFLTEFTINDLWSLFVSVILVLLCFVYAPTLGIEDNNFYQWIKGLYDKYEMIYVVIVNILLLIITFGIYIVIKINVVKKYKNYFYTDEMYVKYINFLKGAKKIYIYSGDLDFLDMNEEQYKLIKKMGSKCYILFDGLTRNNEALNKKIVKLKKHGVNIKKYNVNEKDVTFRGQIRIDERGYSECLFIDKIKEHLYRETHITDQYITRMIEKDFIEAFSKGYNPYISAIVFDLGGVYFEGDFNNDFLEFLKLDFGIEIKPTRNDKLRLEDDMMLGKSTIIDWLEQKSDKKLIPSEIEQIEKKWSGIWKPNPKMHSLVRILKKKYIVTVASNLDLENGRNYIEKGFLDDFHEPVFLSHELKLIKPDKEFWVKISNELKLLPEEVLLIDDHEKNIRSAKEYGFDTIKFSITTQPFSVLEKKLIEKYILI